ncbi:hypothetical protein, partial [Pseudactinotalea sp.]|uniref:mannitol dehydrogenase family protein n=1 Tax=Pseudactinotalea sp. TaxID=1926260 RepID=UPI003B3BC0E3
MSRVLVCLSDYPRELVEGWVAGTGTEVVTVPEGADLAEYGEGLLRRFANPATGHTTTQVSTDGSQKLPIR